MLLLQNLLLALVDTRRFYIITINGSSFHLDALSCSPAIQQKSPRLSTYLPINEISECVYQLYCRHCSLGQNYFLPFNPVFFMCIFPAHITRVLSTSVITESISPECNQVPTIDMHIQKVLKFLAFL